MIRPLVEGLSRRQCPPGASPVSPAHPTLWVLVAAGAAALACAVFVHPNGWVWLVAIGAALAIGLGWPWLTVWGTRAELAFDDDRAREGQPTAARLTIVCRWPWPVHGLSLVGDDTLARALREDGAAIASLRRSVSVRLTLRPERFGPLPRQLRLTSGFPFGLWQPSRPVTVARPLLVWPATHPVGPVPEDDGEQAGVQAGRRVGVGTEACGVRDFREGDRLRLVHWGQSAKHDRLVVRETLADATPCVRVGLDTAREHYADADTFDEAVRQAASCVEGWTRAGSAVELRIGATAPHPEGLVLRVPPSSTARAALDALALLSHETLPLGAAAPANVTVLVSAGRTHARRRVGGAA